MEMLNSKQKIIVGLIVAVVIIVIAYYYINSTKEVYSYQELENVTQETEEEIIEEKNATIKVHITGAVEKCGVIEVKEDARIDDVIKEAGGITEDADLTNVNLAYAVKDGQKIYIPSIEDEIQTGEEEDIIIEGIETEILESNYEEETELININTAGITDLMTLPGIGEATASKIVQYRKEHGKFTSIEEIKNVSGIGDAKFSNIQDLICV